MSKKKPQAPTIRSSAADREILQDAGKVTAEIAKALEDKAGEV
jgi:hypothetical protein